MQTGEVEAWLAEYVASDSVKALPGSPELVEHDWIDAWLTRQLQDDPTDLSPASPAMSRTAIQFLEPFEPSIELLKDLTGVARVSLRPDDGSDDGDPRLRPWRLRHAMQGLHHGVIVLPWYRAARLVHAVRLRGVKCRILPSGVGTPEVPDVIELGSLGLPEPLVAELAVRGVGTVGELRALAKDDLTRLGFPSTVLAGIRRLRGDNPADNAAPPRDPRPFALDPFAVLNPATAESLREVAQAEVERRVEERLPAAADEGAIDLEARARLVIELAPLERRRITADLAARADEICELLHSFRARAQAG